MSPRLEQNWDRTHSIHMLQAVGYLHSVVGLNSGHPKTNPSGSDLSEERHGNPDHCNKLPTVHKNHVPSA